MGLIPSFTAQGFDVNRYAPIIGLGSHQSLFGSIAGGKLIRPPLRPRRPLAPQPPLSGPRYNEFIESPKIRVIGHDGENLGVMATRDARTLAEQVGLDLVEIVPSADPPVCKILDLGKYKYEAQKKAAQARKSQKTQEVKEIKLRPGIDSHDYDVKLKAVHRFIEEGDKVKITLRFRGREMAHNQLGMKLLDKLAIDVADYAKVEQSAKMEGRQMLMVIAPK
jgi:translation initiation factor IF-3